MFTIKHIHDKGEGVYQGDEPQFHADMDSSEGKTASYLNGSGVRIYITGGEVYVMNDLGRTVAHYNLDGVPRRPHAA